MNTKRIAFAIIGVIFLVGLSLMVGVATAQPGSAIRDRREFVNLDRLRRVYDHELGVACYYSVYGDNQAPFCVRIDGFRR